MSAYGGPEVVDSGLVLSLDAGNAKSYPGSGTTWTDLSGNGNNLTLVNSPTFSSAYGGCLTFNGSNQRAYIPNASCSSNFKTMTAYSSIAVIKSLKADTAWGTLYSFGDSSNFIDMWQRSGTRVFGSDGTQLYSSTDMYTSGLSMWAHTTSVASGGVLYRNGVSIASGAVASQSSTSTFDFGIAYDSNTNSYYMNMELPLFFIYNRVLTSDEIQQIFTAYRGRFGL
jgi:hypothetical protein